MQPAIFIEQFADRISLVHARDGTVGRSDRVGRETVLGEGDVDWIGLLSALSGMDYAGPYILRRTDSPQPEDDLRQGRDTLTKLLPPRSR